MMTIQDELFQRQDEGYGDFQSRLLPGIPRESIIGVRIPELRKLAKTLQKHAVGRDFLKSLPHQYYDENMLHGLMINQQTDFQRCLQKVEDFLPWIDNWAVCDSLLPQVFTKHKEELLPSIKKWVFSDYPYTIRFGIGMLMRHYLEADFQEGFLQIPAQITSDHYYVNMMIAWFYATALTKQWEKTISYLEDERLDPWIHKATIQKAIDSRQISSECKDYLRSLGKG